jgi:hypothetical protein
LVSRPHDDRKARATLSVHLRGGIS